MAVSVEELEDNAVYARARLGPVHVIVWRRAPSARQMDEVMGWVARWVEAGSAALEIVNGGQEGISAESAKHAVEIARRYGKYAIARAVVVPGSGVWAGMQRVLQQVIDATVDTERGSPTACLFSELDEAVDWLTARLGAAGVAVDPAALREVAQKLCARQPEPSGALRS
jgi:hypothetical protein